jgi:hypothetical protein
MSSENDAEIELPAEIRSAAQVSAGLCDTCDAVHINLIDDAGEVFATAALPASVVDAFIADIRRKMERSRSRTPATAVRQ